MDPSSSGSAYQPSNSEKAGGGVDMTYQLGSLRNDDSPKTPQSNGGPKSDNDVKDHAPSNDSEIPTTPSALSKAPNPSPRAPSPPRWRFVNEAKKSLGYSSLAAGQVVVGKSAQELGAEYTPPTIVTESGQNAERRPVGKLKIEHEVDMGDGDVLFMKRRDPAMDIDEGEGDGEALKNEDLIEVHPSEIVDQRAESDRGHEVEHDPAEEESPLQEIHSTQPTEIKENDSTTMQVSSAEEVIEKVVNTPNDDSQIHVVPSSDSDMASSSKEVIAANEGETTMNTNHRKKRIFMAILLTCVIIVAVVIGVVFGKNDSEKKGVDSNRADSNMKDESVLTNLTSLNPSRYPSNNPTNYPSNEQLVHSSTNMPTNIISTWPSPMPQTGSPIPFLGNCPPPFEPLSYYDVGSLVSLNRTVFECIDSSCGSFGFNPNPFDDSGGTLSVSGWRLAGACQITTPTFSPSKLSSNTPSILPTKQPTPVVAAGSETFDPTKQSSQSPSLPPSLGPSEKSSSQPTCERAYDNVNACFAIDQSGSVCNRSNGAISGFECIDCQPSFYCNSPGYDLETCCYDFQLVKDFCRDIVISMGTRASDSRFSIVKFSTVASIASELSTADETVGMLDDLIYSGGLTNHADAISVCQQSFQSADTNIDWRNVIVLITDGAPSQPEDREEEAALEASASAKTEGSYIIPIVVSSSLEISTNDLLTLMGEIASDNGNVLNVENFEGLDSLATSLLDQILCEV
ncbi:hypothetical protein ACHAXS_001547 [Conticribra weissflogii]